MATQNQDWLNQFEPVNEPVTNAGALVIPGDASKAREEARDVTRTGIAVSGEERAARGEQRDIAGDIQSIRKEFRAPNSAFANYNAALSVYNSSLSTAPDATGDQELITNYAKMLDPGSVVREGEFATTANTQAYIDRVKAELGRQTGMWEGGMLTQAGRNAIRAGMRNMVENRFRPAYLQDRDYYTSIANSVGYDPNLVVGPDPYSAYQKRIEDYWAKQQQPEPAAGGGAPSQPGAPRIEVATGETFSTEEDFKRRQDSAEAWAATQGTFDQALAQFNATMQAKGYGPAGKETIDVLQWWEQNKPGDRGAVVWELPATGKREGGEPGRVAAAGSALLTGYTGGLAEEVVQQFSPEAAAKLEAAKQYGREEYPGTTFAGEVIGGLMSPINKIIPGAPATAPTREAIIQAVKQGALYGGISGFGEAAPDAGLVERIPGAIVGTGLGAGGGAVGAKYVTPAVTSVVEKYVAPVVSRMISPATQQAIPAAEQAGIPLITSDIVKPKTWFGRWTQETLEKVPIFGTGGARAAQREAREAAITKLHDDFRAGTAEIDDITRDFLKVRGDQIGNLVSQKQEVFANLVGNNVDTNAAIAAIDKGIARYQNTAGYETLIDNLMKWRSNLASGNINVIEDTRKLIGDAGFDQTLAPVKSALNSVVNDIYPALNQDMGAAIQKFGKAGDFSKWKAANEALSDFATDLENSTVKRVLSRGSATPEEAASLLFSKKPSEVRALFGSLSEEGKRNARALIVNRMVENAGGLDDLSPAKFTRQLKDSARTIGVAFDPAEADRLTGLLRALQFTRRADQAAVTTPTGQALIPLLGAGAGGYFAPTATGVLGAITAAARVYETKAVKNILVALSRTAPGSKAEQNVLSSLARVLSQQVGQEGGEAGRAVGEEMAPPKVPTP